MKTMKILQINVVYAKGSTGKIVKDIDCGLRERDITSLIAYGRGEATKESNVYKFCTEPEAAFHKICNKFGGLMYGGNRFATNRLIQYIICEKPDVVHIHCINGYCTNIYRLLEFLAKEGLRTAVTHHAEFFYTGSCGHALDCLKFTEVEGCGNCSTLKAATGSLFIDHSANAWAKMRSAFQSFDKRKLIFTAVSPWVKERSQLSPIVRGYECCVVENGLEPAVFKPTRPSAELQRRLPANGHQTIIHVTASFSDSANTFKGGDKVMELARRMPQVNFVIVSSYSDITGKVPENITLFGRAASQTELAALYSFADLTIIASRRETFSMVVAESLCCGTPVVGYKAGGPESIAIEKYCSFVEYNDMEALEKATYTMLNQQFDTEQMVQSAVAQYGKERMVSEYIDVYRKLMSR